MQTGAGVDLRKSELMAEVHSKMAADRMKLEQVLHGGSERMSRAGVWKGLKGLGLRDFRGVARCGGLSFATRHEPDLISTVWGKTD